MSKIVFVEMPAYGHVNPTLALVQELVRRGEQVVYYDSEEFRALIERTGATFYPYPSAIVTSNDIAVATQSGDLTRVPGVILGATESLLPFLLEELPKQQPDVIALDSNALWGHMAAKMLHLPTVSLMTTFLLDMGHLPMTPREWLHVLGPMLPNIPRVAAARIHLTRRFGRDAFPQGSTFPARGGLNLVFVPRDFQPENARIDESFHFVGPMIEQEAKQEASGDLASDKFPVDGLGAGPLAYISLGTLHRGSNDFFRQCFEAFADLPAQFVLSVGKPTDIQALGKAPANFIVRPFVPQVELLQRAAVFITHGGMNSVLEGLSYGVPHLLIPQQIEQLMIALHVVGQGAGLLLRQHLSGQRILASQLRPALESLLTDPRYREAAQAMQQSLAVCGGYRQAADLIQAYVEQSR